MSIGCVGPIGPAETLCESGLCRDLVGGGVGGRLFLSTVCCLLAPVGYTVVASDAETYSPSELMLWARARV
jgi:hypothetical protein